MCILIDTCTISKVFIEQNSEHHNFKPVKDWILYGTGKMLYGGSKYKVELYAMKKILQFIIELKIIRKAFELPEDVIDEYEYLVEEENSDPKFNDAHLVAIIIASGCKLLCTCDLEAIPFLTNNSFYPKHNMVPKIYTSKRNYKLLRNPKNIAAICNPSIKLTKEQIGKLLK